jgi:ankyrin repeat protein
VAEFLVAEGADVNGDPSNGEKPCALHLAVGAGHFDIARFLIDHGAKINRWEETPAKSLLELCAATRTRLDCQDPKDFFKFLLDIGAELVTPGVSLDRRWGATLSHLITRHDMWGNDLIRSIIESGADVHGHADNHSPLQVAAQTDNVYIAQQLIIHRARVNDLPVGKNGWTALQAALLIQNENKNLQMVRFLLDHGADVNGPAAEVGCSTALNIVVFAREKVNVQLMLDWGAHINATDLGRRGRTALQVACEHLGRESGRPDHCDMIELLLDHGADVNSPAADEAGITALQGAVASGNVEVVVLLLERGARVDAPGARENGRTALEMAAEHGRLDVLQVLLNAHRCEDIRPDCIEARFLAAEEGHLGVVELLESIMSAQGDDLGPLPKRKIRNW